MNLRAKIANWRRAIKCSFIFIVLVLTRCLLRLFTFTYYQNKTMNTIELIRKKRNKEDLNRDEILFLINNYTKNKIPDYQFSAFLMAALF